MVELLLLSPAMPSDSSGGALASLNLLSYHVTRRVLQDCQSADGFDVVVIDGTSDLAAARQACGHLAATRERCPVLLAVTEGGVAAVSREWGVSDIVLEGAGPAELAARLRLLTQRARARRRRDENLLHAADLELDQAAYSARLRGSPLDLTYKEFELLRYLMQHPGQVFTRGQLLHEVWGYDYFGGTRTVDVHVRRLRAKLGADHEAMIGTVRNVGYRFAPPREDAPDDDHANG